MKKKYKPVCKINYDMLYQMLEDITKLTQTSFCCDMETKAMERTNLFTHKDSKKMATLLAEVYGISHCITCSTCAKGKYIK